MIAPDDLPDPTLAASLERLPKSIAPARDLWPGIEGRLRRRGWRVKGRGWIPVLALAAAAAIILIVRTPATLDPRLLTGSAESAEMQLILNHTTGPRSATARSLAAYLSILDGAIAETAAALRETPGDPALIEFLQTLERRRLDLLAQAARFAAES